MAQDVAVVGAGAAGIIAAWRARTLGARVTLYEKTHRVGTKILISGGGKCNITHDGPLEDVLKAFRPNEARFIRPACYRFPPSAILEVLTERGLKVYTRPDGRIFPVDQTAKDVVAILHSILKEVGVQIRFDAAVEKLERSEHGIEALWVDQKRIPATRVVVTVGGCTYPNSGTTGDGWRWAEGLGHSMVPIRAALAPVLTDPEPASGLPGVALRDIVLKGRVAGKELTRWRGDMLFTHHGLSGPTVLGLSRVVAEAMADRQTVTVEADLCPDLTFEGLGESVQEFGTENPRKKLSGFIERFAPARVAEDVLRLTELDETTVAGGLAKKSKNRLVECLKAFPLGRVREVILPKGEVAAGGIALDEVDPKTMASLRCPGLFLAGEVLDIAGPVGGYNLQAAWATGYVAGESAATNPTK
ncbi:MAG: aminoacetone oxidase family FAD-binding enzyme [Chthonomonas sp.]|nr:aminoacetone oxidase family FAD-binding enzyme [Chthonomonas sp.]